MDIVEIVEGIDTFAAVGEVDSVPVFRNELEARAPEILMLLAAEEPPRFGFQLSFDYSIPGQMTVTGREAAGGKPMTYTITLAKSGTTTVDRELRKAITSYDKVA